MKIKLTGWVTNRPEIVTPEEAVEILRDCDPVDRLSEKEIRAKWERGEVAESDLFTAEPVADDYKLAAEAKS